MSFQQFPPLLWLCIEITYRLIRDRPLGMAFCNDLQIIKNVVVISPANFIQPKFKWPMVNSISSMFINSSFIYIFIFTFIDAITGLKMKLKSKIHQLQAFMIYDLWRLGCVDHKIASGMKHWANKHCHSPAQSNRHKSLVFVSSMGYYPMDNDTWRKWWNDRQKSVNYVHAFCIMPCVLKLKNYKKIKAHNDSMWNWLCNCLFDLVHSFNIFTSFLDINGQHRVQSDYISMWMLNEI